MTEHKLAPGRILIDALHHLGRALGYHVEPEWRIPGSGGAVDIAWLKHPDDSSPLLAFEIESRPGEGLANNALKLLGKRSAEVAKPLHLFHVVVRGGGRSDRPDDVERHFGSHNYSVHLLADGAEPQRFLEQVLTVHSRIRERVDGVALGRALAAPPWPGELIEPMIQYTRASGLKGMSERALVLLARESPAFERPLATRFVEMWEGVLAGGVHPPDRYLEEALPHEEAYDSYMAAAAAEALELGLVASLVPDQGSRALAALQRWQQLNHIGDSLGPFTGSGSEWSVYAVRNTAFMWALVAALMHDVPGARSWCAAQPASLFDAVAGASAPEVAFLGLWVMHLCAGVPDREAEYRRARERLDRDGGASRRWLAAPEPSAPVVDDEWLGLSEPGEPTFAPSPGELLAIVRAEAPPSRGPVPLALDALIEDPLLRPRDGASVVALLARE